YTYRFETEPCILVPRTPHGNILQYVKRNTGLTEPDKLRLLNDAAGAIAYLHSQKPPIVHGTIHPFEILVTEQHRAALLCDFGVSRAIEELPTGYTTQVRCGTAGYRAPELWSGGKPTLEGDVYAYGALILKVRDGFMDFSQSRHLIFFIIHGLPLVLQPNRPF
ncbi:hypothetical protein M407DRAFT_83423, partial [Tulasnella calospora MUT 4182]